MLALSIDDASLNHDPVSNISATTGYSLLLPLLVAVDNGHWSQVVLPYFGDSLNNIDCVVEHAKPNYSVKPFSIDFTPSVCGNSNVNTAARSLFSPNDLSPLAPRPSHVNDCTESSLSSAKVNNWSSLFKSLPKNAGAFIPLFFDTLDDNGVLVAPSDVLQAVIDY